MPQTVFHELVGQRLCQLWAFDQDRFPQHSGQSLLAGALAWVFEDAVLVFSSPLRHLHCSQGSVIGNDAGSLCDVGFRVTLLALDCADTWLSRFEVCTSANAPQWRRLIGQRLSAVHLVSNNAGQQQRWNMELAFSKEAQPCSVMYRPELDGLIEAGDGERFELQQIEVFDPNQAFGWLHPAASLEFILDEQLWRSAQMSDWPFAVRKHLQTRARPDAFYRDTLIRALTARFRQWPVFRKRLLAVELPMHVTGVPAGVYEQVRERLRFSGFGHFA
ncbi:hypothetical protein [Limnohabitans sp.]|uniref:hypothetical protein n=1 Tax=Limnohabitans sp. TaxID=1907725 RepID=UPI00286F9A33|nr:hypothetical protein [Limnohabitans sp.]